MNEGQIEKVSDIYQHQSWCLMVSTFVIARTKISVDLSYFYVKQSRTHSYNVLVVISVISFEAFTIQLTT